MCLSTLKQSKDIIPKQYGYKVFSTAVSTATGTLKILLLGEYQGRVMKPRPVNRWLKSSSFDRKKKITIQSKSDTYSTGWHVFHTLKSAHKWAANRKGLVIRKVEMKDIIAQGVQLVYNLDDYPSKAQTSVCKQIKIFSKEIK